jgi:uncharacterized repeat protein (TIGR01451 family)/fimbrial isopeptide formation D2 family protein
MSIRNMIRYLSFLSVGFAAVLSAQPVVNNPVTEFNPADSNRTSMDIGGVWNGATEVTTTTGDSFSVTYTNSGNASAFDFSPRVTLPAGFTYVANSASVSTSPVTPGLSVAVVQVGNELTFNLDPAGYDLPAGTSLTINYGLRAESSVVDGTYQLQHNRDFALSDGGPPVAPVAATLQNFLVQAGAAIINVTPNVQSRAVGEVALFTVRIVNTGLGGLFDVFIDQSAINPGNNLQLLSMTQTNPALAAIANANGDVLTLPYLASGEEFTVEIEAMVEDCGTIVNVVTTNDRTGQNSFSDQAPVQLNLEFPLVEYSAPAISLLYNAPVPVSILIENSGAGDARLFELHTNLHTLPIDISAIAPGWTYNAANGVFTLTANSGTIDNDDDVTLEFDVMATDVCVSSGAGMVTYEARYTNTCANPYLIPQEIGSISSASDAPSVNVAMSVSANRIAVLETGTYTVDFSASNLININDDPIVVEVELPEGVVYLAHNNAFGSVVVDVVARTLTWTLDQSELAAERTLEIDFEVDDDPCLAGDLLIATASSTNTSSQGCDVNATDSAQFLVTSNPELAADQFFNVAVAPDGIFETGNPSATLTRDNGEGEFIPFTAIYEFGAAYPGTWTGSVFSDDFGGIAQQTLVPGSLSYRLNNGSIIAFDDEDVTILPVGFEIDLGFLDDDVGGDRLEIFYSTTISDEAIASGSIRSVLQRTNLILGGINPLNLPGGICDEEVQYRFTQGAFYTIGRASATIGLSMPSIIEICRPETLTITVDNANAKDAYNTLVTLLIDNTEFDYVLDQTPVYGGVFAASNAINYSENLGINPTFEFTGNPLTGEGTIQVQVLRRGTPVNTSGFSARVDYDSYQSQESGANRIFNATAAYAPSIVRTATLALTVTPGTITAVGQTVRYEVFVTNTNAGTAYGSKINITMPDGVQPDAAAMDAANAGPGVFVNGQDLEFDLGDLSPGVTVQRSVIATIQPDGCNIVIADQEVEASWGCGTSQSQVVSSAHPAFFFPQGRLQVVHDSTQSFAEFCDNGRVVIIVRNTGAIAIQDIEVSEILPSAEGISLLPGSVEYRINGGALQAAPDPQIAGDTHTWNSTDIPELAQLVPVGANVDSNTAYEIRIEFDLEQDSSVAGQSPVLTASATATLACGDPVLSPGQGFNIPVNQPRVNLVKTGRNITADAAAPFTNTVYGGLGDVIEWRIEVTNVGNRDAENVHIFDELSGSGGSATISGGSLTNVPFPAGGPVAVDSLDADGGSEIYIITETLGSTCVDATPEAEVAWGCDPADFITVPGNSSDDARINMLPSVLGGEQLTQAFTQLPNGRVMVEVTITNDGGTLYNPVLTAGLPSYFTFDATGPVTLTNASSDISSVSHTGGLDSAPEFTFTGAGAPHILRFGESISFTYYIRPTVFDTAQATVFPDLAEQETGILDPELPATANILAQLDYTNSCGADFSSSVSDPLPLLLPDLDIVERSPNSGNTILTGTTTQNYTFTIRNVGPSGSVAENIFLSLPNLGTGWTYNSAEITSPAGLGGAAFNDGGTWSFTPAQVGTLAFGQEAVVTVNLTYDNSASVGPLSLRLRVRGEARAHDGTVTGNYALDQRAHRILGVELAKELIDTSEPSTTGTNVIIGEDLTYRITARFRGAEDDVSNIIVRDQLRRGTNTGNNNNNFGFVRIGASPFVAPTGAHNAGTISLVAATNNADTNSQVTSGRLDFSVADLTPAATANGATIEFDLVARVMNIANNGNNQNRVNRLGLSFNYLGTNFHPEANTGTELDGSDIAVADLYQSHQVTVRRPQLAIVKEARNITRDPAGAFSTDVSGEAGDEIEYRLIVSNPAAAGERPLHSIRVSDTVPALIDLSATDQGASTDGNDVIDVDNTGGASGPEALIVFDESNTNINDLGSDFAQLDPGQSIILLYRGTILEAATPSALLTNTASVRGFSIPQDLPELEIASNQEEMEGTENTPSGATRYEATADATVTIDAVEQLKTIVATSAPDSTLPAVFVGEQVRYRIEITIPQGTVPNFIVRDDLPAGLALLETPVVTIGSGIVPNDQPTITPGALPASGDDLEIEWEFGTLVASGSDPANRTVVIEYLTQVRNIPANVAGTSITNNARYEFNGAPVNLIDSTITIAEPAVDVVHEVRNVTRGGSFAATAVADAGDVIEYQVTVSNPAGANRAPAYDLNFTDTLPAGMTYLENFTDATEISGLTGVLVEPDVNGQDLVWGREQNVPVELDLAIGSNNFIFTYRATVDDSSQPLQVYTNALTADWTSLKGAPGPDLGYAMAAPGGELGQRTGFGGSPNLYQLERDVTVNALNSTTIDKTKAGDTLPLDTEDDGFRIGDIITYTLELEVQEGTLNDFTVVDALPAGLAFVETLSITPNTGSDGFDYTTPNPGTTAPEAGDTGELEWSFGTLENAGDNEYDTNTLILVYTVRVIDPAGIDPLPHNQTLTNAATVSYQLADATTHTSAVTSAAIVARQPALTIDKIITSPALDALGNYVLRPLDTVTYQITVTNTGTAPAYNALIADTLPEGLRLAAPSLTAATLAGDDVHAAVNAVADWDSDTGVFSFNLADAQLIQPGPGEALILTIEATIDDNDDLKGTTLTNSAEVDAFYSLPSADPQAAHRREYASVGPATADLVVGLRIDGSVYEDVNVNDEKDGLEDWSGLKPTVFANLVADDGGTPIVFRTVTVTPGTGAFDFDYLPPGDFTIVVTDSDANVLAQRPANWLFQDPANGSIDLTIDNTTGDVDEQDLGLIKGVFEIPTAPAIEKTASGETLPLSAPGDAFRIGDLVTYTIDIFPHEGTNTNFIVADTLPDGLTFHDTVSIEQVAGAPRFTYTTPSGVNEPASGAVGIIAWDFGTFTNAIADPAENTLRIVYRARVTDTGTNALAVPDSDPLEPTSDTLANAASLGYNNPAVSGDPIAAGPAIVEIEVEQPRLTLAKILESPALNRLPPEATGTFQLTMVNEGTGPAYNFLLVDTLPVGMRDTAPVIVSATLNGFDVTTEAIAGSSWNSVTGALTIAAADAQFIGPGDSLVIEYEFTIDEDAPRAATLTNSAVLEAYFSKPSGDPVQRREYPALPPATADVVVGIEVSGVVYHDANQNLDRDGGEDWSGATPTVYVNLIDQSDDSVVDSVQIVSGPGDFSFTNLPAGDYTLVFATTPTATESDRPANWLYGAPNNGTYDLAGLSDDALDRDFGLFQDTLASASIVKSASGQTLPLGVEDSAFRVGDLVTYTIDLDPQEGVFTDFIIDDVLPAGLVFVETVSIAQVSGPDRYTFTTPVGANAPEANDSGNLVWNFGNFENELLGPDDNTLRIVYTARIVDAGGIAVPVDTATITSERVNAASHSYVNEASDALSVGPAEVAIDIEQPLLIIDKDRIAPATDNIIVPGEDVSFRLTITNEGSAPAYNIHTIDTLPAGMRLATPTLDAVLLDGVNITGSITPAYNAGSGEWSIVLADGQPLLPGDELQLDYTVTVDASAVKGSVLTNSAVINAYASKPSADGIERRVYDPVGPATEDVIVGLAVSGFVYEQLIPNALKDPSENWSNGVDVYVNIVTNDPINYGDFSIGANQVLRSFLVTPGTGAYNLQALPSGNYRLVVTDDPLNTVPVAPAGWVFDTPDDGELTPIVLVDADFEDQNFGLYRPRTLSGQVYRDTAPYGVKGGDDWTTGVDVVVNLIDRFDDADTVVESIAIPAGSSGNFEFEDLAPGLYRVIVAPAGATTATTAQVPANWVFVNPSNGTRDDIELTTTDVVDQDFGLTPGRSVSGFVFNDTIPNGTRDVGLEDWTTGPQVYVNLVRVSTNTVVDSISVNPGLGDYTFSNVGPGEFRIVVTNAPAEVNAIVPPTWLFRNPATGTININVAEDDFTEQNFALFRGRTVAGVVFSDTGVGGGLPNDGTRNGSEPGIGNVTMRLFDNLGNLLDTTQTDGGGNFRLRIPAETADGDVLIVEAFNPPNHISTGATVGSAGGSYDRATDRITFSFPDDDVTGLAFGKVPDNALLTDGAQTILPGAVAFYRHTFIAGTGGTVVFDVNNTNNPNIPWTQLLYHDLGCDGELAAGDVVISGVPIVVEAGEEICLILRVTAPSGAPFGAVSTSLVTATFTYDNASPVLPDDMLTRQDVTTVGPSSSAGLKLVKEVDKAMASPGELITYTITYTNDGAEMLYDLFIDDRTPAYTIFESADSGALPNDLTAVDITAPDPGEVGSIRWTFDGDLAPGATGTVTFVVRVQE